MLSRDSISGLVCLAISLVLLFDGQLMRPDRLSAADLLGVECAERLLLVSGRPGGGRADDLLLLGAVCHRTRIRQSIRFGFGRQHAARTYGRDARRHSNSAADRA